VIIISGLRKVKYKSKEEINEIARSLIYYYDKKSLSEPTRIDEDMYVEEYIGAFYESKRLSTDMSVLGASSFTGGLIPVYNKCDKIENIYVDPKTIIIDEHLEIPELETRRRFTIAHEIGHLVLHEDIFTVYQRCEGKQLEKWKSIDIVEWQANQFAAALLMPKATLQEAIYNVLGLLSCTKDEFMRRVRLDRKYYDNFVCIISEIYGVSFTCAKIRLKQHPEFWI